LGDQGEMKKARSEEKGRRSKTTSTRKGPRSTSTHAITAEGDDWGESAIEDAQRAGRPTRGGKKVLKRS